MQGSQSGPSNWSPNELRRLSSALLIELYRLVITDQRDRELLRLVIVSSYGIGRVYARFRNIEHLLEFLPIGSSHAKERLKQLRMMNAMARLQNRTRAEGFRLWVNPVLKSWSMAKRFQDDEWKRKLEAWAQLYNYLQPELVIPEMPAPDKTIVQALTEVNLLEAEKRSLIGTNPDTEAFPGSPQSVPDRDHKSLPGTESPVPGKDHRSLSGTESADHTYVGITRSITRTTSDGQNASIMRMALDYIAGDGAAAVEKERRNPVFLRFASMDSFANPLAQAVKDCRENTMPVQRSRAARLMDTLKRNVGVEEWFRLFPNSHSSWTFED